MHCQTKFLKIPLDILLNTFLREFSNKLYVIKQYSLTENKIQNKSNKIKT